VSEPHSEQNGHLFHNGSAWGLDRHYPQLNCPVRLVSDRKDARKESQCLTRDEEADVGTAQLSNSALNASTNVRHSEPPPEEHVLSSWKEIAAYFGKGVQTVQRYERKLGLPIRRPSGSCQSVFAYPSELKDWLARSTSPTFLQSR
jgi:hypothetical protein